MQPSTPVPRGIKPGGLKASKWASFADHQSSSWAARGPSQYIPRSRGRETTAINPATPHALPLASAPPPTTERWWENTPAPKFKRDSSATNTTTTAAAAGVSALNNGRPTSTPPSQDADVSLTRSQREFRRYIQIVRRMKWKLPYLQHGYQLAIGPEAEALDPHFAASAAPEELARLERDRQEAELMFKLDFYEYYMLLERALVHLLGVFAVTVSAAGPRGPPKNLNGRAKAAGDDTTWSAHSYHHNVLAALDSAQNPLHTVLGTSEVRQHLARAKELRNRWKYAEDPSEGGTAAPNDRGVVESKSSGRAPLASYDLDSMFGSIFNGFDQGYAVAQAWIDDLARQADMIPASGGQVVGNHNHYNNDGTNGPGSYATAVGGSDMLLDDTEEEFGFMVDAMDWEAV